MESLATTHGKNGIEKSVDVKSSLDSPSRRSHRSRSRSRDRHSSRSHKDHRDRDRDRDRDRERRRSDRDDRHRSRRSSRSPDEPDRHRDNGRPYDRDHDRERRHRDERDSYRDRDKEKTRERDRERDRDRRDRDYERDRDHRRRKIDEIDEASPRPIERSMKRARGGGEINGNASPMDVESVTKAGSVRERSMESDRRSSTKRSDDGRRGSTLYKLPVDDRSPPPGSSPGRGYGRDRDDDRGYRRRSPPPRRRRPSPSYENGPPPRAPNDDSEARSVFVSQLAARMAAKDLGFFFEEHLGEGSVIDPRIVTDRLSRRSKGIAYVELASIDLVQKAIDLTGTVVMGLPIKVQLTEAERNKQPSTSDPAGSGGSSGAMQLYVGSLHFNLTEADIKQVFEPFGELEFVDLHKDPATGRSKGYAFVQFKRAEDAKMALEQMEGFELAGRQLRVNTVHDKAPTKTAVGSFGGPVDSLDENGGTLNNNSSRHILMQKLARTDAVTRKTVTPVRPNIPEAKTRNIALKNMFDPAEETEQDWDTELAEDVKGECEEKYGPVNAIKVIKESQGEIYVQFDAIENAAKALASLNGRWFGGRLVSASYVSDVIMQAYL